MRKGIWDLLIDQRSDSNGLSDIIVKDTNFELSVRFCPFLAAELKHRKILRKFPSIHVNMYNNCAIKGVSRHYSRDIERKQNLRYQSLYLIK
jgi:hypothetical protein